MNIFEALRADHEIQRGLIRDLVATNGESATRERLFGALKTELAAHAAAEERHFYVPLMQSDLTIEKARHSVAEHHELDELVETLEHTEMSSPGWLAAAKRLEEKLQHHLEEEEHEVFQLAGKALEDDAKSTLARAYLDEMSAQKNKAA
ncbi:MAG: hemerythrin domain-containing protein [Chromatiaceae bacterium]|nr:hemerythrin domain-containing protein [Gammaproteobacteria bacterium]MCP5306362.1 hemerythrin domain-containing protein [Chromatiaceae bacterium]MCP5311914.1 hemerythrin domain-containing protein [Chromatiaceae bacterium]